jgi:hypothetical protein
MFVFLVIINFRVDFVMDRYICGREKKEKMKDMFFFKIWFVL